MQPYANLPANVCYSSDECYEPEKRSFSRSRRKKSDRKKKDRSSRRKGRKRNRRKRLAQDRPTGSRLYILNNGIRYVSNVSSFFNIIRIVTCWRLAFLCCCPGVAIPYYMLSTILNAGSRNPSKKRSRQRDSRCSDSDSDETDDESTSSDDGERRRQAFAIPFLNKEWQMHEGSTPQISWFTAVKTAFFGVQILSILPWLLMTTSSPSPIDDFFRFSGLITFTSLRQLPIQCMFPDANYIDISFIFLLTILFCWFSSFIYWRVTRKKWLGLVLNLMPFLLYVNISLQFIDGSTCIDRSSGHSYFLPVLFAAKHVNLSDLVMRHDSSISCSSEKYRLFSYLTATVLTFLSFGFPCFLAALNFLRPRRMTKFFASSSDVIQLFQLFLVVILIRPGVTFHLSAPQRCVAYLLVTSMCSLLQAYLQIGEYSCLHRAMSHWLQMNIVVELFLEVEILSARSAPMILALNILFLLYAAAMVNLTFCTTNLLIELSFF